MTNLSVSQYAQIIGRDNYNKIIDEEKAVAIAYVNDVPLGERLRHDHEHFLEKRVACKLMDKVLIGTADLLHENKNLKSESLKKDKHINELTTDLKKFDAYDEQKYKEYNKQICTHPGSAQAKRAEALRWMESLFSSK